MNTRSAAAARSPTESQPASLEDCLCELSGCGLLAIEGTDATPFLHGQLTTDVHALADGQSTLTAYADAQGRVLLFGRLHRRADRFLLTMPHERTEPVRQQLAKYILRADVQIHDVSADWQQWGAAGATVTARLQAQVAKLPTRNGESVCAPGGMRITRIEGPSVRWLMLGSHAEMNALQDQLGSGAPIGGTSDWRRLEMMTGLPAVYTATAGHFVAQMLNLDHLGAVDFNKGCFPGQEVMARAHYRGRVKRRMQLFRSGSSLATLPQPGERLDSDTSESGEVVDAVADTDNGALVLAVVPTTTSATFAMDDQTLTLVPDSTTG